jgi:hypothetical protein
MRKLLLLSGALALMIVAAAGPAAAQGFLSAYEDLPLAPGLVEVTGSGLSFDGPGGRIVEAYAKGGATAADVLKFYSATLPQLGWARETDTQYRRESEVLTLAAEAQGRALVVHFKISPE